MVMKKLITSWSSLDFEVCCIIAVESGHEFKSTPMAECMHDIGLWGIMGTLCAGMNFRCVVLSPHAIHALAQMLALLESPGIEETKNQGVKKRRLIELELNLLNLLEDSSTQQYLKFKNLT
jgi:hypothetical protein